MTVTVSDAVVDVLGRKDARPWRVWSPVYREGDDGVVSSQSRSVDVTDGVFTAELEPGVATIESPDGDRWTVTVPDHDAGLAHLIAVAQVPPTTAADVLSAAVAAFLSSNADVRELIYSLLDFDFRLDDTRVPIDGSVTVGKLAADLAAALKFLSEAAQPGVFRLGRSLDDSVQASQVEVWVDGSGDASSRVTRWTPGGQYVLGSLFVGGDTDAVTRSVAINSAAGQTRELSFRTADSPRWIISTTPDAESGSDAGSNLQIRSRTDAGTAKTTVVGIDRQSGVITLGGVLAAGSASTVTAAGTTTLSITDAQVQEFTGSTTQTVKLPTTGVKKGMQYTVINNSTGAVTVQSSGANTIATVAASDVQVFVAKGNAPTGAADWRSWAGTTTATASTVVQRDSNANITADGFIASETSTATAAGTTTLTVDSTEVQVFTGSTTQSCVLPTTSITAGRRFIVCNQSSGNVTVKSSDGTTLVVLRANKIGTFTALIDTPTTSTHWGWSAPTASAVANTVALRDSNTALFASWFLPVPESTATAAGTTTLTLGNTNTQIFTGTSTQTVKLPTSSVPAGMQVTIINQSTGDVTVQSSGGNTIATLTGASDPSAKVFVALTASPTTAAHWRAI